MRNSKKRNTSTCRLLAVAILAVMLISVLPLNAVAVETEYKGEILQQPTAEGDLGRAERQCGGISAGH